MQIMAEYIWVGSAGSELRSRTVVLDDKPLSAEDLPIAGALSCGRSGLAFLFRLGVELGVDSSCAALLAGLRCFLRGISARRLLGSLWTLLC